MNTFDAPMAKATPPAVPPSDAPRKPLAGYMLDEIFAVPDYSCVLPPSAGSRSPPTSGGTG